MLQGLTVFGFCFCYPYPVHEQKITPVAHFNSSLLCVPLPGVVHWQMVLVEAIPLDVS
ncbi:MAG: hypothetical protein R2757_09100 [Draconibacterium sp.]